MHSYIVRIYHENSGHDDGLMGTVEAVDGGRQWTFKDGEELWAILQRGENREHRHPGSKAKTRTME